jgi:hypothetical protein
MFVKSLATSQHPQSLDLGKLRPHQTVSLTGDAVNLIHPLSKRISATWGVRNQHACSANTPVVGRVMPGPVHCEEKTIGPGRKTLAVEQHEADIARLILYRDVWSGIFEVHWLLRSRGS